MLLGHKLVNAAQTKIILSNIDFNKSGITPERILNYFNFKMFLSTWVLSDATQRVCVVPLADKRGLRQKLRDPESSLLFWAPSIVVITPLSTVIAARHISNNIYVNELRNEPEVDCTHLITTEKAWMGYILAIIT